MYLRSTKEGILMEYFFLLDHRDDIIHCNVERTVWCCAEWLSYKALYSDAAPDALLCVMEFSFPLPIFFCLIFWFIKFIKALRLGTKGNNNTYFPSFPIHSHSNWSECSVIFILLSLSIKFPFLLYFGIAVGQGLRQRNT